MRCYGQTDAPQDIAKHSQLEIVADIVDLAHTLGYENAVIVGHDWGSTTAASCATLRPDMFRAVVQVSGPYSARAEAALKPSEANRQRAPEGMQFYQTYYQRPGVEEVLEADTKRTLRMWFYSSSGGTRLEHKARYTFGLNEKALDGRPEPARLPCGRLRTIWITMQENFLVQISEAR